MKIKYQCTELQQDMFGKHSFYFHPVRVAGGAEEGPEIRIDGNNKFVLGAVYQFEVTGPINTESE